MCKKKYIFDVSYNVYEDNTIATKITTFEAENIQSDNELLPKDFTALENHFKETIPNFTGDFSAILRKK